MSLGCDLWFGLLKSVNETARSRLQSSRNLFDALLLETFGRGQSHYRAYLEEGGVDVPDQLSPFSDSHVALSGLLLASTVGSQSAHSLSTVLDAGLKKVSLKNPIAGMPGFANDWKLLLGAAVGVQNAEKRSLEGDWRRHRAYILKSSDNLLERDFTSGVMAQFIRQTLREPLVGMRPVRRLAELSLAEVICAAWAHHLHLSPGIPESECWMALADGVESVCLKDLGFCELSLLLVLLKDNWAVGWASRHTEGIEFVKSTLRGFLPCAKRDLKAELIRSEADVQRILWAILRPVFPDLVDEDYLQKFGAKNYKPDFGIPSLQLLIEAKYVNSSKTIGDVQDELHADIIGYRETKSEYTGILFFIYDTRGELAAQTELHRVIREQSGVEDLIVVVGPAPAGTQKPRARTLRS